MTISPEAREIVDMLAKAEGKSRSGYIEHIIREKMKEADLRIEDVKRKAKQAKQAAEEKARAKRSAPRGRKKARRRTSRKRTAS